MGWPGFIINGQLVAEFKDYFRPGQEYTFAIGADGRGTGVHRGRAGHLLGVHPSPERLIMVDKLILPKAYEEPREQLRSDDPALYLKEFDRRGRRIQEIHVIWDSGDRIVVYEIDKGPEHGDMIDYYLPGGAMEGRKFMIWHRAGELQELADRMRGRPDTDKGIEFRSTVSETMFEDLVRDEEDAKADKTKQTIIGPYVQNVR